MDPTQRGNFPKTPFSLRGAASPVDDFSETGVFRLTKCQSGTRVSPTKNPKVLITKKAPQLPAFPRICRHHGSSGPWQNPPASGFRGALCQENKFSVFYRKTPSIYRYLSNFTEIPPVANEPVGFTIIPEFPESARTGNAGKCGLISSETQRISSGCREGVVSASPQMRALKDKRTEPPRSDAPLGSESQAYCFRCRV